MTKNKFNSNNYVSPEIEANFLPSEEVQDFFTGEILKPKQITKKARKLKKLMLTRRISKASLIDIQILIDDVDLNNFDKSKKTQLYINHGGEYCEYLEILS